MNVVLTARGRDLVDAYNYHWQNARCSVCNTYGSVRNDGHKYVCNQRRFNKLCDGVMEPLNV